MENHERIVHNYWSDQEKFKTQEFKTLVADAEKIAEKTKRCTPEELLKIAREGRAMTAADAYQILIQDRTAAKASQHWTDN